MLTGVYFSDGAYNLLDVGERSGLSFSVLRAATDAMVHHDLVEGIVSVPVAPRAVA